MATEEPAPADGWRAKARRFSRDRIAPRAEAIDREDRVPPEMLSELGEAGFLGIGLSPEYGGRGGGAAEMAAVLEELAEGSAAVATMVAVHLAVAAAPVERWGSAEQKERYLRPLAEGRVLGAFALTEPSVGSDAAALTCRFTEDPDGYRIQGTKMFITDADLAGVILSFATRDPSMGHRGISAFLVTPETPGFTVAQRLPKLGLHGSTTTEIVFDQARVPRGARLGPLDGGFRVAMEALSGGRIGIAACALGVARAAYDAMRDAARADPEDWKRAEVARSFVELEGAATLLAAAAQAKDAGRPFVPLASAAKLAASGAAVRIASRGIDVAGRVAGTRGSRAERLLRDARVFPIVEGTTEIQELILGRELLGR